MSLTHPITPKTIPQSYGEFFGHSDTKNDDSCAAKWLRFGFTQTINKKVLQRQILTSPSQAKAPKNSTQFLCSFFQPQYDSKYAHSSAAKGLRLRFKHKRLALQPSYQQIPPNFFGKVRDSGCKLQEGRLRFTACEGSGAWRQALQQLKPLM